MKYFLLSVIEALSIIGGKKKEKKPSSKGGFYDDRKEGNTNNGWREWVHTGEGIQPILPKDRTEIH